MKRNTRAFIRGFLDGFTLRWLFHPEEVFGKGEDSEEMKILNELVDDIEGPRMGYPEEVEDIVYHLMPRIFAVTKRKELDPDIKHELHMQLMERKITREEVDHKVRELTRNDDEVAHNRRLAGEGK